MWIYFQAWVLPCPFAAGKDGLGGSCFIVALRDQVELYVFSQHSDRWTPLVSYLNPTQNTRRPQRIVSCTVSFDFNLLYKLVDSFEIKRYSNQNLVLNTGFKIPNSQFNFLRSFRKFNSIASLHFVIVDSNCLHIFVKTIIDPENCH